eukprot:g3781.t1
MRYQKVSGGWLTAEYSMLPYSTHDRKSRDISRGKLDGRSSEIQRLIGRSMRAVVDLQKIGQRTLWIDCDVLQADGGTRTASITGACVATAIAFNRLMAEGKIKDFPLKKLVAAVSAGVYEDTPVLDLNYLEDKAATVDFNIVMTEALEFVEVQGAGEEAVFTKAQMDAMLELSTKGISEIFSLQKMAILNADKADPVDFASLWDWLVTAAPHFDVVVIAGDLLDIASIVPFDAQIIVVRKYLNLIHPVTDLIVSSGNHDVFQQDKASDRNADWLQSSRSATIHVDGGGVPVGDCFFSILPWCDTRAMQDRIETLLTSHRQKASGKRWIWVHHAPPHGSPTAWDGHADMGDTALPGWIETYRPEMVLCGHIHQAPFYAKGSWIDRVASTWVFNSGRQIGPVPTATVIDTVENTARWVSMEDSGEASLAE